MRMVAVKQIRLEDLTTEEITQLVHEVGLVERLSHPNIIKYEGMVMDSPKNTLSLVLECVFTWLRHVFYSNFFASVLREGMPQTGHSSGYSRNLAS